MILVESIPGFAKEIRFEILRVRWSVGGRKSLKHRAKLSSYRIVIVYVFVICRIDMDTGTGYIIGGNETPL